MGCRKISESGDGCYRNTQLIPNDAVNLNKQGLNDDCEDVRERTAEALKSLATINPDEAVILYDIGLSNDSERVRRATAGVLKPLAPVRPDDFIKLYKKGLDDDSKYVRRETSEALSALVGVQTNDAVKLFNEGLDNVDEAVRRGTVYALRVLVVVRPDETIELYKKGFNDDDVIVRRTTVESLRELASVRPDEFIELYKKGINDFEWSVVEEATEVLDALVPVRPDKAIELYKHEYQRYDRYLKESGESTKRELLFLAPHLADELSKIEISVISTAYIKITKFLEAIASVRPAKAVKIYEEGLSNGRIHIQLETARALGALASTKPDKAVTLYEMGLSDDSERVRQATAGALQALAPVRPYDFIKLYKKGLDDVNDDVKVSVASALKGLASVRPDKFVELFEEGLLIDNERVKGVIVSNLGSLAPIMPEKYIEFYNRCLSTDEFWVIHWTVESLKDFAKTIMDESIVPIHNEGYLFSKDYLNSKYVKTKRGKDRSEKRVLAELKQLVQDPDRDYSKLTRIFNEGKAKDFAEIIECYSLNHPDFIAIQRLGSGKFGTTYLMQNIGAEKKLHAFKFINPEQEDTISLEARVHNTIGKRHKNLAEMYAIVNVEVDGKKTKAIDMEYIQGKTLRERLDEKGKLNPKIAVKYGLDILKGLSYLHSKDIHHRDLKPDNIMIDEDDIGKVIDFGLSKTSEITSQPFMNRAYAPPEFYLGEEYGNSDVWSFGLVLYEMLTGEHLFTPSAFDTYFKDYIARKVNDMAQFQEEIGKYYKERIAKVRKLTSRRLERIIEKCIKVNPEERYQSIDELASKTTLFEGGYIQSALHKQGSNE